MNVYMNGGNPYMSQLMAQLGLPGYILQQQAAQLPGFALPGIHQAYMNALGPAALLQPGLPIPPFLSMPSPAQMQPVMAPVCGCGYAGRSTGPERFDMANGAPNNWFSRLTNPERRAAAKFERTLKNNPLARAAFEQAIGGRIVDFGRGGKADGVLTIERFPGAGGGHHMPGIGMNPAAMTMGNMFQTMDRSILGQAGTLGLLGAGGGLLAGAAMGNPFMGLILGGLSGLAGGAMMGALGGGGGGMWGGPPMGLGGWGWPAMGGLGGLGGSPLLGQLGMPNNVLTGQGMGSFNPNAMAGQINNTNPLYEQAHQSQVAGVLNDPSLSVEDKVMLMLMLIMKKMDQDIEHQMQYINALQQQQSNKQQKGKALGAIGTIAGGVLGGPVGAGIGGGLGGKLGGGGNSSPSVDVETQKLQRMIQKRSQMFEMCSAIMRKYDDTAKNVIQNIR